MKITLNGGELDCSLNGEKDIGEVLVSLDEWLESQGLIMTSIALDGKDVCDDLSSIRALPVSGISALDIGARPSREWRRDAVRLALSWLDEVAAEPSATGLSDRGKALLEDRSGLLDAEESSLMEWALARLGGGDPSFSEELMRIRELFSQRLAELEDPVGQMRRLISEYGSSREELSSIPVLMQTSKDREAMERLGRFTAFFSSAIRLMPLLSLEGAELPDSYGEEGPDAFYSALNGALRDLLKGFEDRDTVQIGDLCEYEILPRMDTLFRCIASGLPAEAPR